MKQQWCFSSILISTTITLFSMEKDQSFFILQTRKEMEQFLATNPAKEKINAAFHASKWGEMPLSRMSVDDNFHDLVSQLLEKGADANPTPPESCLTPLHQAAFFNAPKNLQLIIDALKKQYPDTWKIILEEKDFDAQTPLHNTIDLLHFECAHILLSTGVNKNIVDKDKNTLLHIAALKIGHPEKQQLIIQELFIHGINPNQWNQKDLKTPYQLALYKSSKKNIGQRTS